MDQSADHTVDLRSDTLTLPSPEMRLAMAEAPLGDDVFGEDPSINALQDRAAQLLGKEAALLVPSGTMANLVAVMAQTRPGDAVILSQSSHTLQMESGNVAMVAGVLPQGIPSATGILSPVEIERCVVTGSDHHHAPTALIAIENTAGSGGGAPYPLETVQAIGELARRHRLRLHCDGARLFNAAVATGVSPAGFAAPCDTVSFCFSKGLGAPIGSIVVGSADTIERAHRFRKMLGGGMRQGGVVAAAAQYALEHNIDRLAEDHRRAAQFRALIEGVDGVLLPMPTETNMVFLEVVDAERFVADLAQKGVLAYATAADRVRVVFHLDIDDEDVERAAEACRAVAAKRAQS
jgi:threonine aldolase